MNVTYYTGTGVTRDSVTIPEIVETLAMDAAMHENDEFDGMESDTLKKAVERQTERFRTLMGDSYMSTVFPEES